jgi:hypothetical protein
LFNVEYYLSSDFLSNYAHRCLSSGTQFSAHFELTLSIRFTHSLRLSGAANTSVTEMSLQSDLLRPEILFVGARLFRGSTDCSISQIPSVLTRFLNFNLLFFFPIKTRSGWKRQFSKAACGLIKRRTKQKKTGWALSRRQGHPSPQRRG